MTPETNSKTVLRGTSVVGSITLLSRVLGFVRDLLMARLLGAGLFADAFFVAFRVPNVLRSFVAEGALTSAFVPVFTDELQKGQEQARQALRSTCSMLLATTFILSALGIFFAPELVDLFAPGFRSSKEKSELCASLLQIMMPFILFTSLVAMLNGALNSVKIFGAAAFAQVAMNLCMIGGILLAYTHSVEIQPYTIASFVLVGGLAQIIVQIPAIKRSGLTLLPSLKIITPITKKILVLMIPAILGAAVYQLSLFINTVLASLLEEGSVSWLFYADRLAQLPIGVFTVALTSVLLPTLSKASGNNDSALFNKSLVDSLRYLSFLLIPLSFGMFLYAEPLVQLLFERGAFTSHLSTMTSLALKGLTIGLWAVSCQMVVARAFISRKDTVTPALMGIVTLAIGICTSLFLMGEITALPSSLLSQFVAHAQAMILSLAPSPAWGHVGLALSSGIAAFAALAIYLLILIREGIDFRAFIHATQKSLLASCGMALVLLWVNSFFSQGVWQLIYGVPIGIVSYASLCFLLKSTEFSQSLSLLTVFLKNRKS